MSDYSNKTYLLLKKTLYGLKRSPKHWFNKATPAFKSIGLKQCINAPCLFRRQNLGYAPYLYLGLYVDDFVYYSKSPQVEKAFEDKLKLLLDIEFESNMQNFLGQKVRIHEEENDMNIFLSRQSTTEELIHKAVLSEVSTSSKPTPYRSGYSVDKILSGGIDLPMSVKLNLEDEYCSLVGSLNWPTTGTRPDIATITNMLSAYLHNSTHSYLLVPTYFIKYLKGTSDFGIFFSTKNKKSSKIYVRFPLDPSIIVGFSDASRPLKMRLFQRRIHLRYDYIFSNPDHFQTTYYGWEGYYPGDPSERQ